MARFEHTSEKARTPCKTMMDIVLQHRVEQFYYREALLLDTFQFDQWLALFTDNASYKVGTRIARSDRHTGVASPVDDKIYHIQDDKDFLATRVKRLHTGFAHVEEPPSSTRHLVANVSIADAPLADGRYRATADLLVTQFREDAYQLYSGRREDLLRDSEGDWLITERTVILDCGVLPRVVSIFF